MTLVLAIQALDLPAVCKIDHVAALDWDGPTGGDARLRAIVPLFSTNGHDANYPGAWALIATHLPGRRGRECQERWLQLQALDAAEKLYALYR